MKWSMFLILLLVPGVFAAPLEYWSVPGDEVQDVINAANFAATMKGSVGVSFTGKTREQVDEATQEKSLNDVVMVMLDGTDATIMAGLHPEFDIVVANAQAYLLDQGFDVEISEPDAGKIVLAESSDEEAEEPAPEPVEEPVPTLYADVEDEPPEQVDPPSLEIDAGPADDDEPPEPEQPGVFSRIWSWFAGLFQ